MDWAAGQGADAIVTAAADTPFFPLDLVAGLRAAAAAGRRSPWRRPRARPAPTATRPSASGRSRSATTCAPPSPPACARSSPGPSRTAAPRVVFPDPRRLLQRQHPGRPRPRRGDARGARMRLYGVTGWKNSGKTVLVERLVAELTARGLTVSTVKHAHHAFDVDQPGKDSHRHRAAGAAQVLVASRAALGADDRAPRRPRAAARRAARPPRPGRPRPRRGLQARPPPEDRGPPRRHRPGPHRRGRRDASRPSPPTRRSPGLAVPVFHLDDIPAIADFILARIGLR